MVGSCCHSISAGKCNGTKHVELRHRCNVLSCTMLFGKFFNESSKQELAILHYNLFAAFCCIVLLLTTVLCLALLIANHQRSSL
jgi:hypothetical protein